MGKSEWTNLENICRGVCLKEVIIFIHLSGKRLLYIHLYTVKYYIFIFMSERDKKCF